MIGMSQARGGGGCQESGQGQPALGTGRGCGGPRSLSRTAGGSRAAGGQRELGLPTPWQCTAAPVSPRLLSLRQDPPTPPAQASPGRPAARASTFPWSCWVPHKDHKLGSGHSRQPCYYPRRSQGAGLPSPRPGSRGLFWSTWWPGLPSLPPAGRSCCCPLLLCSGWLCPRPAGRAEAWEEAGGRGVGDFGVVWAGPGERGQGRRR